MVVDADRLRRWPVRIARAVVAALALAMLLRRLTRDLRWSSDDGLTGTVGSTDDARVGVLQPRIRHLDEPPPGPPDQSPPRRVAPERPARYANVVIRDPQHGAALVAPGTTMRVDVDIGALRRDGDVVNPVPLPDELLPREDIQLDVLLSSPDVRIGRTRLLGAETAVEQRLLLPADGGPARTRSGGRSLQFYLEMPRPEAEPARARLSYLYENVVVQSQRIDFVVVDDADDAPRLRAEVRTDFTLSQRLGSDLDAIGSRDRVSVVMNETAGRHQITVRAVGAGGQRLERPFAAALRPGMGADVERLRDELSRGAPTELDGTRARLRRDLARIAPLGNRLHASLPPELRRAMRGARQTGEAIVLEIVLTDGSTFTLPWSLVYDIPLDGDLPMALCRCVETWDERGPLVEAGARACPYDEPRREQVLCPFGFWGFRHTFEVLTTTERPKHTVALRRPSRVVIAESDAITRGLVNRHVTNLGALFRAASPDIAVIEARTKQAIRAAIGEDLPFLYFLCHGARSSDGAGTVLSVGKDERISPTDVINWIDAADEHGRRIWSDPQPLVFVNACGSLAITPADIVGFLDAFVRDGNAVGVIGTETRVDAKIAIVLAERFFEEFLRSGATLETAMHRVKTTFLARGNLVGLAYTPYALADLSVSKA